jgi:hypothetical protein
MLPADISRLPAIYELSQGVKPTADTRLCPTSDLSVRQPWDLADLAERRKLSRLMAGSHVLCRPPNLRRIKVAKAKKTPARKLYTADDIKLLKQHSKARTPVVKISKQMKRSVGSLRQKALDLGIGLGHQR